MSEEQKQPVRFRPNTKDAELWVSWLNSEYPTNSQLADEKLRLYQERDDRDKLVRDVRDSRIKTIQDAIEAGVLYVDASGIGMVHLQRLESNLLFVKPLPNNQPS